MIDGLAVAVALQAVLAGMELNRHWMSGLLRHLLRLPIEFFERRHTGGVTSSFNSITVIQRTLSGSFIAALIDGALALGTLAMMAWYSRAGALITLATMAVYGALRAALQRPLRQASAEQIVHAARAESHFLETLRGMQTVRLFSRADQRQTAWSNLVARCTNAELRVAGLHVFHFAAQQLLLGLQRVVVLWLAARTLFEGGVSLGTVFAFLAYMDQFTRRTGAFIDHVLDLLLLRLHVDRVSDILLTPQEPLDAEPHPHVKDDRPPSLQIRDLRYAYGSTEDPVLDGISFDVGAGECVAITGPSGCGKTTLVKLMLGLLTPPEGRCSCPASRWRRSDMSGCGRWPAR